MDSGEKMYRGILEERAQTLLHDFIFGRKCQRGLKALMMHMSPAKNDDLGTKMQF